MNDFNDSEYTPRILDILKSAFYNNNPTETKLTEIRKYTEIHVRRMLNLGSDYTLMLGQLKSMDNESLENLGEVRQNELIKIVDVIRKIGNEGTHTQRTKEFTDSDYTEAVDALFDLIAFQFVSYFKKYPMKLTSPNDVMSDFSLLPPIIRFKTLDRLLKDDPDNIQILNRITLSRIKTFGKPDTYDWLKENESNFRNIQYPTEGEINEYICKCGVEVSPGLIAFSIKLNYFDNVYDLLKNKIDDPRTSVNEKGKLYDSFESAITYYRMKKHPDSNCEIKELHSIIDFVYIGRKSEIKI